MIDSTWVAGRPGLCRRVGDRFDSKCAKHLVGVRASQLVAGRGSRRRRSRRGPSLRHARRRRRPLGSAAIDGASIRRSSRWSCTSPNALVRSAGSGGSLPRSGPSSSVAGPTGTVVECRRRRRPPPARDPRSSPATCPACPMALVASGLELARSVELVERPPADGRHLQRGVGDVGVQALHADASAADAARRAAGRSWSAGDRCVAFGCVAIVDCGEFVGIDRGLGSVRRLRRTRAG